MKKIIAIAAGGDSSESNISLRSAQQVLLKLNKNKFDAYITVINKQGWYVIIDNEKYCIDKNNFTATVNGNIIKFDCVFNAIHGTPGEDGKLQAYFELMHIPYTSSNVLVSALTFNKYATKTYLRHFNITMAKEILLRKSDNVTNEKIIEAVGLPCFVKPNKSGSSYGVSKVKHINEITDALNKTFAEDDEAIIEEFIKGRELTCGMMRTKNKEIIFPVTEIVSKNEYFDYEAKYKGMSDEITPAPIPDDIAQLCQQTTIKIGRALNCRHLFRVDYIYNGNKLYMLEVNTVPGMTEASIIPQQAAIYGIALDELYEMLIDDALNN